MKYLPLVLAGLWRKPARTIFTFLSIAVAFILFGILSGLDGGIAHTVGASRLDRLFTNARFGGLLPATYQTQIANVPGVTVVAPWMGLPGYYQDPKKFVFVYATDGRFFTALPELTATKQQIEALERTKAGAIVTKYYADKYGWKAGDKVPLLSHIVTTMNGDPVWTFDIVAVIDDADRPGKTDLFIANYKYINDRRVQHKGATNTFIIRIDDPRHATEVGKAIDKLFANSGAPTLTRSEKTSAQSNFQRLGDIGFFTHAIVIMVLFMLLFLTGNTMMQSARERIPEFAVLKTLGFSNKGVLALVFAESVILCLLGALGGLVVVKAVLPMVAAYSSNYWVSMMRMPWSALGTDLGFALAVAFFSSLLPALRVRELSVVDALARRR